MNAITNPLLLSDEALAKLDARYPRTAPHANVPEAHLEEAISQFERFEKRQLSDDERKLARFIWHARGEDDYIAVETATAGDQWNPLRQRVLAAILKVANKQYFSRSEAMRHVRPMGYENLNP